MCSSSKRPAAVDSGRQSDASATFSPTNGQNSHRRRRYNGVIKQIDQCRLLGALLFVMLFAIPDISSAAKQKNGFDINDALVPTRQIRSGGPPRDGIPALSSPDFDTIGDTDYLEDSDRVLGISYHGVAKAYPIKVLNYHEIVNDRFKDVPIAVTFCPLCGSGIAFLAEAGGQARSFGVSGLLYNSDVLMYDRETESLWSQIMAQAISGPAKGTKLQSLPLRHTTWLDWRLRHPDTLVLKPPRDFERNYNVDPYAGYADSNRVWFPVNHTDRRYSRKSVVIGVKLGDTIKAYPFEELSASQNSLDDSLEGQAVTVEYDLQAQAARIIDADGQEIPSFTAYWFAWVAFHPDTEIYTRP